MRSLYLLISLFVIANVCNAGYSPEEEQKLKFLYIKNFIKNIEWPKESSNREFKIVILGDKHIYDKISLSNIKSDHVNGLNIAYYFYKEPDRINNCQLIYIPKSNSSLLNEVVKKFKDKPVLIISEENGLCSKGSLINFVSDGHEKLTFEYNQEAFKNSGLLYSVKFMEQGILINPTN